MIWAFWKKKPKKQNIVFTDNTRLDDLGNPVYTVSLFVDGVKKGELDFSSRGELNAFIEENLKL